MIPCWPTPILISRTKISTSLNEELRKIVLSRASDRTDFLLSQVGGCRTEPDLLRLNAKSIDALINEILDSSEVMHKAYYMGLKKQPFPDLICEAWGNIYRAGDFQIAHIHHDSIWSGVYCVQAASSTGDNEGLLRLYDPRPAVWNQDHDKTYSIRLDEGIIVLFPSWLRHDVSPHSSDKDRITIAFNIGLESKE